MVEISCRPAVMADIDLLYNWVNESAVRRNSFNSDIIPYSEHKKWFDNCLSDKNCEIYIFYLSDIPLGQVRLNYSDGNALIDYSIDQKYRGQGYGKIIIREICETVRKKHPEISYMVGEVKFDNIASQKVFEDNDYRLTSNDNGVFRYCKDLNEVYDTATD